MLGSTPDLLRLLVVPAFAWAAWRDVRTRRVPNRLWYPLAALGLVLLAVSLASHLPVDDFGDRRFLLHLAVSLGFVVPLVYGFWWVGGFGGADAKALMTLALVFPTYPVYFLPTMALPRVRTALGVFSLTILTNTVLVGLAYPVVLGVRNALARELDALMFLGLRVSVADLPTTHGKLFETLDGRTRRGLDLDALRMYLRWRGTTLAELRDDPVSARDPASVTATHEATDGAVRAGVVTDGGTTVGDVGETDTNEEKRGIDDSQPADPWAAERFLDDIEGTAYGTTPEKLRAGLELVTERETVWVSPGIPFIVPMFVGLLLALTYGDLLFGLLSALRVI